MKDGIGGVGYYQALPYQNRRRRVNSNFSLSRRHQSRKENGAKANWAWDALRSRVREGLPIMRVARVLSMAFNLSRHPLCPRDVGLDCLRVARQPLLSSETPRLRVAVRK